MSSSVVPTDVGDIETVYTLTEAVAVFFRGNVTVRHLQREISRGRLEAERIGRRLFVTELSILEYRRLCRVNAMDGGDACRGQNSRPDSSCESAPADHPSGLSSTERERRALEQASLTLERLKKPSPNTSPSDTSPRVVPLNRTNSSSRKS